MIAPFLLSLAAFALLGLATDAHHRHLLGRACPPPRARLLRCVAWGGVAVSFLLSLLAWGPVFGAIGWFATLIAGAAASFCLLNFVPVRRGHVRRGRATAGGEDGRGGGRRGEA